MWRTILMFGLIVSTTAALAAQEQTAGNDAAGKAAVEKLRDNPDDTRILNAYASEAFREAYTLQNRNPEEALQKLDELEKFVDGLNPTTAAARQLVAAIKRATTSFRENVAISKLSLADLEGKLTADPTDAAALQRYLSKVSQEMDRLAEEKPDEALATLDAAKATLTKLAETATDAVTKRQLDQGTRNLAALGRRLEAAQKMTRLIGQPATPLKVEAWVNGSPLTDDDLKGKVVLLDFWAVWCGPCIATFPHLREWNERYGDKGLVIIGLTNYYNFKWDAEAKKAAHSGQPVSHEEEQEMLVKFAESHGLKHRFGIEAGGAMSDYYGVTGIPHVVVIDQQGTIRLMKVGSGEENAKAIADLLAKLLTP
jgi:thiol-disulfide isomerase/thioredoxin